MINTWRQKLHQCDADTENDLGKITNTELNTNSKAGLYDDCIAWVLICPHLQKDSCEISYTWLLQKTVHGWNIHLNNAQFCPWLGYVLGYNRRLKNIWELAKILARFSSMLAYVLAYCYSQITSCMLVNGEQSRYIVGPISARMDWSDTVLRFVWQFCCYKDLGPLGWRNTINTLYCAISFLLSHSQKRVWVISHIQMFIIERDK